MNFLVVDKRGHEPRAPAVAVEPEKIGQGIAEIYDYGKSYGSGYDY